MTLLADLDPRLPSAEDEVLAREAAETLHAQVGRMTTRHATALTMRYGLHGEPPATFKEVGAVLGGVTGQRARQICAKAEEELLAIVMLDERYQSTPAQRRAARATLADIHDKASEMHRQSVNAQRRSDAFTAGRREWHYIGRREWNTIAAFDFSGLSARSAR